MKQAEFDDKVIALQVQFEKNREELKDKKIENIYSASPLNNQFEQEYIAIILEDGTAYYTEDLEELNNFSTETLPEFTPIRS